MSTETESEIFRVVVNHEEQYSIWPDYREIPTGWREAGVTGTREQCLDHIETVWTDMRPLSLRLKMEELKNNPPPAAAAPADEPEEESLVERLSTGRHPVEISLRPTRELSRLKDALERGYVHVKFAGTRGGTELGVRLDPEKTDLAGADLEAGTGELTLAGSLQLDFTEIRCIASIQLPSMEGLGYLVPVEA
jgi:uncharacterized protein YbdZ (MbtH family)